MAFSSCTQIYILTRRFHKHTHTQWVKDGMLFLNIHTHTDDNPQANLIKSCWFGFNNFQKSQKQHFIHCRMALKRKPKFSVHICMGCGCVWVCVGICVLCAWEFSKLRWRSVESEDITQMIVCDGIAGYSRWNVMVTCVIHDRNHFNQKKPTITHSMGKWMDCDGCFTIFGVKSQLYHLLSHSSATSFATYINQKLTYHFIYELMPTTPRML